MSISNKTVESVMEEYEQWRKKSMRQFMMLMLSLTFGISFAGMFFGVMVANWLLAVR